MICSDQKAISDWTLNSSTHIKSEADPIYDCVIKPIGFHNDSSIAVRSKRRPTQNEHYYSSTPDELDDGCPQAPLTKEKTTTSPPAIYQSAGYAIHLLTFLTISIEYLNFDVSNYSSGDFCFNKVLFSKDSGVLSYLHS